MNNAAQRILEVLKFVRKCPEGELIKKVWSECIGCESHDILKIYGFLSLLNDQVTEIERSIKGIDGLNHALYLQKLPALRPAFAPKRLEAAWQDTMQHLKPEVVTALEFCADALSNHYPEEVIPAEDLQEIEKQLRELKEELFSWVVDVELRTALLDLIAAMELAISEYRIGGAVRLRRAFLYSIGGFVANRELIAKAEDKGGFKKLALILVKLGGLVEVATHAKGLCLKVKDLLLPSGS